MSSTNPFKHLGLKNGAGVRDVKRAYSKLLKVTRPDDDPEAFMALRTAYDQALSRAKHAERMAKDTPKIPTKPKVDTPAKPEPEIYYDKTYDYHFNTSDLGELIKETVIWVQDQQVLAMDFFPDILASNVLSDALDRRDYQNFLACHIFESALPEGAGYEELVYIDQADAPIFTRPDWLGAELVELLEQELNLTQVRPDTLYLARYYNAVIALFTPVLQAADQAYQGAAYTDLLSLHAAEMDRDNQDAFGSFFDTKTKRWMDMSPVGRAMRDITDMIDQALWGSKPEDWHDILERDDVQSLAEFQDISTRIRALVLDQTGFYSEDKTPKMPKWLTGAVLRYLDDTYGWSRQRGRHDFEHQQFSWLHRLIEKYADKPNAGNPEISWAEVGQSKVADLGYQPLPWFLSARNMLLIYLGVRALQMMARLA
ncbi:hypothetical protein GCM10007939_03800 [Amylibacter marinus]|uniref:J domain-containing protein n=1 Tax=Amylibacter marinus TaxID=1475483 RepID=A0ABQ5VSH9_9RHOB|nr:hypothetical protein [Amylibacter marinus]GLQ34097.1 hypothetical protein GCM10007939_03800 [Amylibacter marinus]